MNPGNLLFRAPLNAPPPEPAELEYQLREIGLIGQRFGHWRHVFLAGNRFLQLVTFLGCSPYLRLEPEGDDDTGFCRISFIGPFARPRLIHGSNTRPPRCPHCGARMSLWRESLASDDTVISCPHCNEDSPVERLDWRRNAGSGRFFLQLSEVFPGEAVPLPAMMEHLRGAGPAWDYFYVQQ